MTEAQRFRFERTYLTTQELADRYGVSIRTINNWASSYEKHAVGVRIKRLGRGGGRVYYPDIVRVYDQAIALTRTEQGLTFEDALIRLYTHEDSPHDVLPALVMLQELRESMDLVHEHLAALRTEVQDLRAMLAGSSPPLP